MDSANEDMVMIKFENPQNQRYYYITVQEDLFKTPMLSIYFGGKNHHHSKHYGYGCKQKIDEKIKKIAKKRLKRGYIQECS